MPDEKNIKSEATMPVDEESGKDWLKLTMYVVGGVIVAFLLALAIALAIGIFTGESEDVAAVIAIVRDLFIILLAMQGMLIAIGLLVLILQLATLINLLQNEVSPIVQNLQETSKTLRGTSEFLSKNMSAPVIETKATMAGVSTFFKEITGIRKATKRSKEAQEAEAAQERLEAALAREAAQNEMIQEAKDAVEEARKDDHDDTAAGSIPTV